DGELGEPEIEIVSRSILADPILNDYSFQGPLHLSRSKHSYANIVSVFHKPGVIDPVEASTIQSIKDLGFKVKAVRTGRKFILSGRPSKKDLAQISRKILANEVIDQFFLNDHRVDKIYEGLPYSFNLVRVPLLDLDDEGLVKLSQAHQLALDLKEMQTVKDYFTGQKRNPTDIELETIAQTWSEHCKHKTLMGLIEYTEIDEAGRPQTEKIDNLLRQTVMKVTNELACPWCISVFKDNAGIIEFDKNNAVCFKVETHNHPSAIEPYGGAGTGIGGVIRDSLGCGLGAKPVLNTDIFCFGLPDLSPRKLPPGVLHPKRILKGVVSGVRDYGNRMGIPTANGAVYFDERYTANPLVYCGNIGLMPRNKCFKHSQSGDLIVLVGGRTGRDGIHGVTFASLELTASSEVVSGSAVQIGNAITEKKVVDTI
ncbi:MAG: phosphoribosylformylglycinamidine synthase subunit PurS, partial [Planctomycetota bacterium]